MSKSASSAIVVSTLGLASLAHAGAVYLPTNLGIGADAEVRESNPDQNRGTSTEIATRVRDAFSPGDGTNSDALDRNSVIYLQFDLDAIDSFSTVGSTLRLTYRNNNMSEDRIHDTDAMFADFGRNGLQIYGIPGATFNETAITYNTAPGMTPDGDIGTKDFNASAMLLGDLDFPPIGSQSHLPIGNALDFSSALLDAFLATELTTNRSGVAVLAVVHRNDGLSYDNSATKTGQEPPSWSNFNYLFNPKEQTTLNSDASYDADLGDPNNPLGGPHSSADNSTGLYSPQLIFVPAPPAAALMLSPPLASRRRR